MFNNVALDVFIGLIFIFLLYSLLATIIQEIIAQTFDLRARMLIKSVRVLLDDRTEANGNLFQRLGQHIWQNMNHFFCPLCDNKLSKAFYQHPAIKYLAPSSWRSKPSYIASTNFSTTLIKLLRGQDYDGTEPQMNVIYRTLFEQGKVTVGENQNIVDATLDPETLLQLRQLYHDAQKDIDRFKILLEKWFNDTMDRTTGWYKKQNQMIAFLVGLALAIIFNVDTIAIHTILSKDEDARKDLVDLAIRSNGKYDSIIKQTTKVQLRDSSLQIMKSSRNAGETTIDTFWRYREYDTLMMSSDQLREAYDVVLSDIKNANQVLGLGRNWKDTCKTCDQFKDSILSSNLSKTNKDILIKFLDTDDGKKMCEDNKCIKKRKWFQYHPLQTGGIVTLFGWLLTALAISMGAPFWFDLLNKVIKLRASGPKPKDDLPTAESKNAIPGSSPNQRVG